jgi:hypothetical protein
MDIQFFAEKMSWGTRVVWAYVPNTETRVRYVVDGLHIIHFSWENEASLDLHKQIRAQGLITKGYKKVEWYHKLLNPTLPKKLTCRSFTKKVW